MSAITSIDLDTYHGYQSGASVPWPVGKTTCQADGIMSVDDASNAFNISEFGIEVSFDNGSTWHQSLSYTWQAGANAKFGVPYNFPIAQMQQVSGTMPTHVRAFIKPLNPLLIGVTITFS